MKEKGQTAIVALGGNGVLQKKLEDAGIKTYSISRLGRNVSLANDNSSFWDIFKLIKRERPDVLHLHSPKAAGLGALAGRILGIRKIVFTVHGWTWHEERPLIQKGFIIFFSWLTMVLVHKVILLSQREYDQTLRFPAIKEKLQLIPLGMKQPVFMSIDGSRQVIAKSTNYNLVELNKKIIIGTVAELHKNKGMDYLVNSIEQVAREHNNVLCIVMGDGEERERLINVVRSKHLEDNLKFLGYIDDASHYIKAFNMFVLPSIKEGLPYVLLEAGFASLPVIATTVGGIPEIVDDMRSGVLVQPKNSRELAHAISFMIEHPHMRRQYGATLRESVIQRFSIEKMIGEIEKVYKK